MSKRKAYVVKTNKTGGHVVATGRLHVSFHAERADACDFAACMNFAHDRAVREEHARARRAAKRSHTPRVTASDWAVLAQMARDYDDTDKLAAAIQKRFGVNPAKARATRRKKGQQLEPRASISPHYAWAEPKRKPVKARKAVRR